MCDWPKWDLKKKSNETKKKKQTEHTFILPFLLVIPIEHTKKTFNKKKKGEHSHTHAKTHTKKKKVSLLTSLLLHFFQLIERWNKFIRTHYHESKEDSSCFYFSLSTPLINVHEKKKKKNGKKAHLPLLHDEKWKKKWKRKQKFLMRC